MPMIRSSPLYRIQPISPTPPNTPTPSTTTATVTTNSHSAIPPLDTSSNNLAPRFTLSAKVGPPTPPSALIP